MTNLAAKFRIGSCGFLLSRAIEVSLSVTKGAGGFSISPTLQCARVISSDDPHLHLFNVRELERKWSVRNIKEWETALQATTKDLALSFEAGIASPYDVNRCGHTLLHVCVLLALSYQSSGILIKL